MNNERFRTYKLGYEFGGYFLWTKNDPLSLYFVIPELTKINTEYIPKEPFLDQAFEYGLQRTPHKKQYQQELYPVDERKAFYKLALSKTGPIGIHALEKPGV
jgi:hypothetical protein